MLTPQRVPDREIVTGNGRRLILKTYFDTPDAGHASLTAKVVEGRLREYRRHNVLLPETRADKLRGPHIEIVVVVDPATDEAVASLRKIHTTGVALEVLPSYHRFEEDGEWVERGKHALRARAANRPVVEIACLWKSRGVETGVKIELCKAALQASVGRGELWFMGVLEAEYGHMLREYGPRVIHTLGNLLEMRDEEFASDVRARPVMLDPATFYDELIDEIVDARSAPTPDLQTAAMRGVILQDYLIGLDESLLSDRTLRRLEGLNDGIYAVHA